MLGNKKSSFSSGGTTLVATDTTVVGDIHFSGCLDIEGVVQGDIIARDGQEGLELAQKHRLELKAVILDLEIRRLF